MDMKSNLARFFPPAVVASAAFALLSSGCGNLDPASDDSAVDLGQAAQSLGDSCSKQGTGMGMVVKFATHLSCSSKDKECKSNALTLEEQIMFSSPRVNVTTIKRRGSPLLRMETDSQDEKEDTNVRYFSPISGVQEAFGFSDGVIMTGTIDGRDTEEVDVGTPPDQIGFLDGGSAPQLVFPGNLKNEVGRLFKLAQPQIRACLKKVTGASQAGDATLEAPGVEGHFSDTFFPLKCQTCRGECAVAWASCFHGAVLASIPCNAFYALCFAGEVALCTGAEIICDKFCHAAGGPCCPVACGGEKKPFFFGPDPRRGNSVGCCTSGETCLDRGQGLCCSSGLKPCGGSCCGDPNVCLGQGKGATCCSPGQVCGSACCSPQQVCQKIGGTSTCRFPCAQNSDCGGQDICVNGVCEPG
jgi:hypothetical protein